MVPPTAAKKTNTRGKTKINPKNGKWLVALIIGAPADLYRRRIRTDLVNRASIVAPYHIEDSEAKRYTDLRPKPDVDVAFIITDFIGHSAGVAIRKELKKRGIPVLFGHSEWSRMYQTIYRIDYPRPQIPEEVKSTLIRLGDGLEPEKVEAKKAEGMMVQVLDSEGCNIPLVAPVAEPSPAMGTVRITTPDVLHIAPKPEDQIYMLAREIQERLKVTGQMVMISADSITIEKAK